MHRCLQGNHGHFSYLASLFKFNSCTTSIARIWCSDFNHALSSNKSSLFSLLLAVLSFDSSGVSRCVAHHCFSLPICTRATRESHCPLLSTAISDTTELIVQPSSRQYPGTLPAARYQDLSWAVMHNNRFYWLEWWTLLATTLASRSLLNCSPPPPKSRGP